MGGRERGKERELRVGAEECVKDDSVYNKRYCLWDAQRDWIKHLAWKSSRMSREQK